jgi:hypothetical protein
MTRADKALVLLLRIGGVGSLLALVPAFMPFPWMAATPPPAVPTGLFFDALITSSRLRRVGRA